MNILTKTGVLLVNLGTPDAPTPKAIKRYLSEFLLDRHVVDLTPLFWYPLLKGIILPLRVNYITQHYASIWTEQGSPLLKYSQSLNDHLQAIRPDLHCELAMTYGNPSIHDALEKLRNCQHIVVLPLYPQYSTTTTLAVLDKVQDIIKTWSVKPEILSIRDYASHPDYISALANQIELAFQAQGQPDILLFSYHGIPEKYITQRHDDYVIQCELTTRLVSQELIKRGIVVEISHVYQSRFGRGKWTEPNITPQLITLAKQGKQHVHVICPGFAVDCIETLDEIAVLNRKEFIQAGGEKFYYIPALNDSPEQTNLMNSLLIETL